MRGHCLQVLRLASRLTRSSETGTSANTGSRYRFAHHLMCMPESKSPTSSPSAAWLGEGMALVALRPSWRCQKHVVSTHDEPTTHDNLHADCAVWSFLRTVNLIQWMPYEPLACSGTRKRALSRPLLCLGFFATRTSCSQ